jgi:hypothetical protein
MSTHAQGVRPVTPPSRMGRPKTVRDGVATSVYLPLRYVVMIGNRRRTGCSPRAGAPRLSKWAGTVSAGGGA